MGDPVLDALERDEAYSVVQVLAKKPSGMTELVVPLGGGPLFVRKRIPLAIANIEAWTRLSSINHPHLPHVIEMYQLPDQFVVVCAYVGGFSALRLVDSQGPLETSQVLSIIEDVCEAAGVLHAYGIIHRDITPSNVIIANDGAHLIDLGIARVEDASARHDTTRLGTWGFAAPEQFGFAQTDARSDVYSIGSLAAFLLTGILPDEQGFEAALEALPKAIRTCIDKARAFEPSARFGNAAEFSLAFSEAVTASRSVIKRAIAKAFPAQGITLAQAFRSAPTSRKLLALLLPLPILAMPVAGFNTVTERWGALGFSSRVGTVLFYLIYSAFWIGSAFNCARALVGAGKFATEGHRVARFLLNEILMFFAMIALMVVVSYPFGLG